MALTLKKLEQEAMKFTLKDRARLAECLLNSLDNINPVENEKLWTEEAERRYKEYKKNPAIAIPSKNVFKNAYSKIR